MALPFNAAFGNTQTTTPKLPRGKVNLGNVLGNFGLGRTGSTTNRKPITQPFQPSSTNPTQNTTPFTPIAGSTPTQPQAAQKFAPPFQPPQAGPGVPTPPVIPPVRTVTLPSGLQVEINQSGDILTPIPKKSTPTITEDLSSRTTGTINSDILASPTTRSEVLTQAQNLFTQQQDLQAQVLQALQPSQEILDLRQQIRDLNLQEQEAFNQSEQRLAPSFAITGEQQALQREANFQRQALTNQLEALVDQQSVQLDALTKVLGFSQDNLNTFLSLQEATAPNIVDTVTDPSGAVMAFMRDPLTGQITQQVIGQVTPEVAGLDFAASGTFVNSANEQVFWGLTNAGEFVTQSLGAAKGDASGSNLDLVRSITQNPFLFNQLTSDEKADLIPALDAVGFDFPRDLSGTEREAQNNANAALTQLEKIEDLIFDDTGGIKTLGLIGASTGRGELAFARNEVLDIISRLRTGAALTSQEENFYKRQLPRVIDDAATARTKLNHWKALFAGMAGANVIIQDTEGNVFEAVDMFDQQTRADVRNMIGAGGEIIEVR